MLPEISQRQRYFNNLKLRQSAVFTDKFELIQLYYSIIQPRFLLMTLDM